MTRVAVTPIDIHEGERRMALLCPLARAITRAVDVQCSVGSRSATLYAKDKNGAPAWLDVPLPSEAIEFRHAFDEGRPVAAFFFDISTRGLGK